MTSVRLIGLHGKSGVGKSTVGTILACAGYVNIAFADPLKMACAVMFNEGLSCWETQAGKAGCPVGFNVPRRKILQSLGTEWGRAEVVNGGISGRPIWQTLMQQRLLDHNWHKVVITDVRFEDEADLVREHGGVIWHILRPEQISTDTHASEQGIFIGENDVCIINGGNIDTLRNSVMAMLST